jgi:hypothetical protein
VLFTLELIERLKGLKNKISIGKSNICIEFKLETGVVAYAVHPGVVATELERHMEGASSWILNKLTWAKKTPVEGAQTTLHCALEEKLANQTGLYYRCSNTNSFKIHRSMMNNINFSDCGTGITSCRAKSKEDAKKLWSVSEELVKEYL